MIQKITVPDSASTLLTGTPTVETPSNILPWDVSVTTRVAQIMISQDTTWDGETSEVPQMVHLHSLDKAALAALLRRFKSDDWLVLKDDALRKALTGEQPLSRIEWNAVLDSPLTLRRMNELNKQMIARKNTNSNILAHQDYLKEWWEWESPNYKNTLAAQSILGRELTPEQIERILDTTNEVILTWGIYYKDLEIAIESLYTQEKSQEIIKKIEELTLQYHEYLDSFQNRIDTFKQTLMWVGFTLSEIHLLLNSGSLLSQKIKQSLPDRIS